MPGFITLLERSQLDWDFIVLTEVRLTRTHCIPALVGNNYTKTKNNSTQNAGVIVYYKSTTHISIEEVNISDCNYLAIKPCLNMVILVIYQPLVVKI